MRVKKLVPQFMPILQTSLERQKKLQFFLQDNYLLDDALGRFLYHSGAKWLEAQRYLSALDFDINQTGHLPCEILQQDISCYGLTSPYITVHSGINAVFKIEKTPLKCWSVKKWEEFLRLFKQKFPHIQVVQVGGKNSPRFANVDKCLVGQTNLKDLPAILQGSLLHIDGESGLVQLTRWLDTKAVVLFANTAPSLFALSKNINLSASQCGCCMWLEGPSWHTNCLLGYSTCANMDAHDPQQVLEVVLKEIH
jgi:ADP-heptose:LPS heptosyltransferase